MRGVHLKRKLKDTEKAGVVASCLLHCSRYVRYYSSECYNRDIQMHNTMLYILWMENFLVCQNFILQNFLQRIT